MTRFSFISEKKASKISPLTLFCIVLLPVMLCFGVELKEGALYGIRLSLTSIIPTLFPFFILSDLWSCYVRVDEKELSAVAFKKIFGINESALPSFLLGTVCGFPLGVSSATGLYEKQAISKDELERISGFANNPSCAFVISGVGAGIFRDVKIGIMLYISVVLSAVTVGILFKRKEKFVSNSGVISRQSFSLVDSIKNAGISSITVAAYIIFFSSLICLLSSRIKSVLLVSLISCFLEVSNACVLTASLCEALPFLSIIITGFALGFSGFSVHLQAFAILPKEISKKRYLFMKLIQGMLCALIVGVILLFTK